MRYHDVEQRSDRWYALRCGSVGASEIASLMAKTKSGYSSSRSNLMARVICERLTGKSEPMFVTAAMQDGIDTEPQSIAHYEFVTNTTVIPSGLFQHPTIDGTHATPDGLIGEDGLIESKSPKTSTHIGTLISQTIPNKYLLQMQWQMACTGRQWCDFVSYDPRMPPNLQMWVKRVERDDKLIAEVEAEVVKFLKEVNDKLAQLEAIK